MKKLLLLFAALRLCGFALNAQVAPTTIQFNEQQFFSSGSQNRPITIRLLSQGSGNGPNIVFGTPIVWQPTNGVGTNTLLPATYTAQFDGLTTLFPFAVPQSTNVYNLLDLIQRYFYLGNPALGIATGTNVTLTTNWIGQYPVITISFTGTNFVAPNVTNGLIATTNGGAVFLGLGANGIATNLTITDPAGNSIFADVGGITEIWAPGGPTSAAATFSSSLYLFHDPAGLNALQWSSATNLTAPNQTANNIGATSLLTKGIADGLYQSGTANGTNWSGVGTNTVAYLAAAANNFISNIFAASFTATNGITNLSATASKPLVTDANKKEISSSLVMPSPLAVADPLTVTWGAGTIPAANLGSGSATANTLLHGNNTFSAVSASADITGTLPIANGGTGQTTARLAQSAIGVYPMSIIGGGSGLDFAQTTPSSEAQLGLADYGTKIYSLYASGSTTKGDWQHGFSIPGGILSIGDGDIGDPLVGPVMTVNVNNGHTGWATSGDSEIDIKNWSSNANNSGGGFNISVMGCGVGINTIAISSGGTSYAVGDTLTVAGGTTSGGGIGAQAVIQVTGVSSGVITSAKLCVAGEYTTSPSTPNSPTGGSGSGASFTLTFIGRAVTAMADNSCSLVHVPTNRIAGLAPGNAELVFNTSAVHQKNLLVCSPTIGPDSGNYSLHAFDFIDILDGVPMWVNGKYQPGDSGWAWATTVSPQTGLFHAYQNVTIDGTLTSGQANGQINYGNNVGSHIYGANGGTWMLCNGNFSVDFIGLSKLGGMAFQIAGQKITFQEGPTESSGSGSPNSVVTAPVGSTYRRTDGGAGTSFYVKETGSGNTGWVGK